MGCVCVYVPLCGNSQKNQPHMGKVGRGPRDLRYSHTQSNLMGGLIPGLGGRNPLFPYGHPPPTLDQFLPFLASVSDYPMRIGQGTT